MYTFIQYEYTLIKILIYYKFHDVCTFIPLCVRFKSGVELLSLVISAAAAGPLVSKSKRPRVKDKWPE